MEKRFLQPTVMKVIYKLIMKPFLKFFVGIQYPNADFLKNEKQFVLIANHNSHLDTLSLMTSLPGNLLWKVKPVAAEDYFGNTKFKAALSNYLINTLLINRKSKKEDGPNYSINKILQAIDEGYSLILFPEGTRGEPEQMSKMKSGIARILAQRPGLKYVPVYMTGMGKSFPKGTAFILPYNATLHFGEPTLPKSTDSYEIMDQIVGDFNNMVERYAIKDDDDDD